MRRAKVRKGGRTMHVGRTLLWLREELRCIAQKVEHRALIIRPGMAPGTAKIGPSQDLFGVADIVAVESHRFGVVFIQVCARDGLGAHRRKIRQAAIPMADPVVPSVNPVAHIHDAGAQFWLVSYELTRTLPGVGSSGRVQKGGRLRWIRRVEKVERVLPNVGDELEFTLIPELCSPEALEARDPRSVRRKAPRDLFAGGHPDSG